MTLEERLADSMSLSRGPGPPGHSQPCKRTSALSIIVSDITNLLEYGRNQEACALAASSRAVLPYALVSMVSRLKQGDPIKPPMVIFFADMAHLFPSVRPILKNALPQASLIGLIDSADVSTQDQLALSMLMLHMAGSLSSIAISINALGHDQPAVRWVAAVAISQNLCLSASESNQLLLQTLSDEELRHSEALWERRQIDVQALRAQFWDTKAIPLSLTDYADSDPTSLPVLQQHVCICGVMLPARCTQPQRDAPTIGRKFIRTSAMLSALKCIALAVQRQRSVLVSGPAGCGKSSLILELARATGNDDFVELYMDAHVDSKALLGSYICSSTPGEFYWRPGPLAEAVHNGQWIILDNLHLAPTDVLVLLESIVSSRVLHVPQRGEAITAHPNFALLATVQTNRSEQADAVRHVLPQVMLSPWWHIGLPGAARKDQLWVLAGRFPSITTLIQPIMAMMHLVCLAMTPSQPSRTAVCEGNEGSVAGSMEADSNHDGWRTWIDAVDNVMATVGLHCGELILAVGKPLGMHDLVKICARITELGGSVVHVGLRHLHGMDPAAVTRRDVCTLSEDIRAAVLAEAADVLCGCTSGLGHKSTLLQSMAALLGLPRESSQDIISGCPSLSMNAGLLKIGRVQLNVDATASKAELFTSLATLSKKVGQFAMTAHARRVMESVAAAVKMSEPLLLVGESGTGKTASIQFLAEQVGRQLLVINLSSQSDASDLLGGMRPVQVGASLVTLSQTFANLIQSTYPAGKNAEFLARVHKFVREKNWNKLMQAFDVALKKVSKVLAAASSDPEQRPAKKARLGKDTSAQWKAFEDEAAAAKRSVAVAGTGFAFQFVEGLLMKALRAGKWILLDEINLAPPQVLERIMGLLENSSGNLVLPESDQGTVTRHPGFQLFAAMNPATDSGKRHLPFQIRSHFTEVYVAEPTAHEDLMPIISAYQPSPSLPAGVISGIVRFFVEARKLAPGLTDGSAAPAYNLRSLARAMQYVAHAVPLHGLQRSLFDGFSMAFAGMLDAEGAAAISALVQKHVLGGRAAPGLPGPSKSAPAVLDQSQECHVNVEGYWIVRGSEPLPDEGGQSVDHFSLTPTVKANVRAFARALSLRKHPLLLQGPTSSGKTTLVEYMACLTGHQTVRINNHQHTDLQEYLGAYAADDRGQLVFREGALVRAARHGHWVILDELNLAPTDVLEALNRLLDDNRELFVPELGETIHPHPHFMLFGTQNPAGVYAGRKALSRAFRSRFLQISVPDLPSKELVTVLEQVCAIAPSHAAKMVAVMQELRMRRSRGAVFAGQYGLITPRDLFRWAARAGLSHEELALHGYCLLAERLRTSGERDSVQEVLMKVLKVSLDPQAAYIMGGVQLQKQLQNALDQGVPGSTLHQLKGIVWTNTLQRMYFLTKRALEHQEAVLLVGETGVGKTTLCQTLAFVRGQRLRIINCNLHTEAADMLGGYRPARDRNRAFAAFCAAYAQLEQSPLLRSSQVQLAPAPGHLDAHCLSQALQALDTAVLPVVAANPDHPEHAVVSAAIRGAHAAAAAARAPFIWEDGPLVKAMREGSVLLIDEVNLAEDAVLERLNSVLEPGRTLLLAEKGGPEPEKIVAAPGFRVIATMNPGGDHGKRELSPALSNRFTQVWVSEIDDKKDIFKLVRAHLPGSSEFDEIAGKIVDFWVWYGVHNAIGKLPLSLRDLLAWCEFVEATAGMVGPLPALLHGAYAVIIDGQNLGSSFNTVAITAACKAFLAELLPLQYKPALELAACSPTSTFASPGTQPAHSDVPATWGIEPFVVRMGPHHAVPQATSPYHLDAPTTSRNCFRILRAMQLPKPILLEGSPGVGKTSVVTAIADATGHELIRINLSDQTDMSDLLGADLPAVDGAPGIFSWADGPLVRALRLGAWVLLDELNLASQAVLEGLNSVLDHRREIFIPELGETVAAPEDFRVFAAQNPLREGGGRKGLPRSFLNRFSRVSLELLLPEDLLIISRTLYPTIPQDTLRCMVATTSALQDAINVRRTFAHTGGPWEFNLRDVTRWCDLVAADGVVPEAAFAKRAGHYARMLFVHKLHTLADQRRASDIIEHVWRQHPYSCVVSTAVCGTGKVAVVLTPHVVQIGECMLKRSGLPPTCLPPTASVAAVPRHAVSGLDLAAASVPSLEWVASACKMAWMSILVSRNAPRATWLVRVLAQVCAQPLVEIPLSPMSDTSDLLGGFEQMDMDRVLKSAEAHVRHAASVMCREMLCRHGKDAPCAVVQELWELCMMESNCQGSRSEGGRMEDAASVSSALRHSAETLQRMHEELSWLPPVRAVLSKLVPAAVASVSTAVKAVHDAASSNTGGHFVWVDGLLLSAIEQGHWVLMQHANTCSNAVLDRLNSLLEPSGVLLVNESGSSAGGPRVVKSHSNFRLFMVMDPGDGGLSRAMRNRGVEVFLDAHQFSEDPAQKMCMEVIDEQSIPGQWLPAWLGHNLAQGVQTFKEAIWRCQQASQLIVCATHLVEQGVSVFHALTIAHTMVAGGVQSLLPRQSSNSFAAFAALRGHSGDPPDQPLLHSISSLRSFPTLPDLSSGRSQRFVVVVTVTRLLDVLLSQVVARIHSPCEGAAPCDTLLPPLIPMRDRNAPVTDDLEAEALQVLAAAAICLLALSTDLIPTMLWLVAKALVAGDHMAWMYADVPHMTSIACLFKAIKKLLQLGTPGLCAVVPQHRHECVQLLLSCTLERCSLQQISTDAEEPDTALQWAIAVARDSTRRPQRMHAVVPHLLPLLDSICAVEAACMEAILAAGTSNTATLAAVRHLQHVRQHVKVISHGSVMSTSTSSFAAEMPCLVCLVQHMQGLWLKHRDHLQALVADESIQRLDVVLEDVSKALKLHLHAPEAHLLRTSGGTMPLPADPAACDAWVQLSELAAACVGLHVCSGDQIMQVLGRAGLHLLLEFAAGTTEATDNTQDRPDEKAAYIRAAAKLACNARVRVMLVEGAALCVAATLQEGSGCTASESSNFVCSVVAQCREAAIEGSRVRVDGTGQQVSAARTLHRGPVSCGVLPLEHLALPSGCGAQLGLSQLETLAHAPAVLSSLIHITVASVMGVQDDLSPALKQLQVVLGRSTCSHPLLASMAHVLTWCHEQQQPSPPNVQHAAWFFWHATASALNDPLPDVAPVALASALPRRLADLLATSTCSQRRLAICMHLSPVLPLCLQRILTPSGATMEELPTHRAALAQTLRSLLSLSIFHARTPPPAIQELARITVLAGHTLSVYHKLCGSAVIELSNALCEAVAALHSFPSDALKCVSDRCFEVATAALVALCDTAVPALSGCRRCLPVLLQCIADTAVVAGSACKFNDAWDISPQLLAQIGHVSVQLAVWRAELLLPPPGLDPAMASLEQQRHLRHVVRTVTDPTRSVALMAQTMPLLPDQTAVIAQAGAEAAAAEVEYAELERARVSRPSPPQYDTVVAEAERCLHGLLQSAHSAADSLLALTNSCRTANMARQALLQGYSAVDAVAGWCSSMSERFPLYADQLSPFMLAVLDVQRGLATVCVALEQHVTAMHLPDVATGTMLRSCLAFPLSSPYARDGSVLQPLLEVAVTSSAVELVAHINRATIDCLQQVQGVPEQALQMLPGTLGVRQELKAQLLVLHVCALHASAPGMEDATLQALHAALQTVIGLWRTGNELREELQRQEESLFKTKSERILVRTDDEELEEQTARSLRRHTSLFSDLGGDDLSSANLAAFKGEERDTAAAVTRQLSDILDDAATQHAMVTAHAVVIRQLFASCGLQHLHPTFWAAGMDYAGPCATAVAGILSCRANQVLETSGGHVAADLTKHVVGGAVRQLLSSIASLYPHRVPGQAKDSVDVMSPCLEEKSLAVATVAKLQQHVSQLLERYPEQPLLDQLQKICKRILGMPCIAPLKDAMVGVELLVTRVQDWQSHNASVREQTSLAEHQAPLAALCTRWRKMELASWSLLVEQALDRERHRARVHWFHLVGLILSDHKGAAPGVTEVLAVVEQYLQSASVGQYETRLHLLGLCAAHCAVLTCTGRPSYAPLQRCLENVAAYYAIHLPAVREALQSGLEPVMKEMNDFVTLQKWEYQGTIDLKLNIEKIQRKLIKCRHQAVAAVRELVTPVFSRLTQALGIDFVKAVAVAAAAEGTDPAHPAIHSPAEADKQPAHHGPRVPQPIKVDTRDLRQVTAAVVPATATWVLEVCSSLIDAEAHLPVVVLDAMDKSALINQDLHAVLVRLYKRVGCTASASSGASDPHLRDILSAAGTTAGIVLDECFSMAVGVSDIWAREGQKGARAMRKKGLVDNIKSLLELGLSPSRTTVPPSERTPTAWFLSEQQEKMPALASVNGQTVPVQLPESIAVPLQQTWSNACLQFQKTFAAVHMLRDAVRNSKHGDISQHEAARMTTVAEHLLHIMRQQQSAAYTSCRQICSMEHLCRLLVETLTSPCASFNDAHCRKVLDALTRRMYEAVDFCRQMELLHPHAEAMLTASMASSLNTASKAVEATLKRLEAASIRLKDATISTVPPSGVRVGTEAAVASRAPLVITSALLEAIAHACKALQDSRDHIMSSGSKLLAQDDVPEHTQPVTVADVYPSWHRLQAMLNAAASQISRMCQELPGLPSEVSCYASCYASKNTGLAAVNSSQLSDEQQMELGLAAQVAVREALIWAQGTKKYACGERKQGSMLLLPEAVTMCQVFLQSACADRLCAALQACVRTASQAPLTSGHLAGVRSKFLAVVGCTRAVLAGMRACLAHVVLLHAATGLLALTSTSVFLAYIREGLGQGEGEAGDVDNGEGTGTFKEEDGAGLGDGDTTNANDVSNQIENEDQIMGAQQKQPRDDDGCASAKQDDSKGDDDDEEHQGIEMQHDFDGIFDDVPEDAANIASDEDAVPEMDKEMGDAGEEADVLDDKMWLNEEDDMGEKPEGNKAGMAGESGAESCLKMVAGGEDEEQKQDSAANEAQRASEKDKVDEGMGSQDEDEVGDDVGEVDVAEVAEQRAADDFVQTPVLQQEMDVPDELNLDGCDSDMDEGGGQTDQVLPAELDADEAPEAMDADDAQAHGDEQHEVVCSDKGDMDGSSESGDVDIVDDVSPSGQEEQQHDEDVSTLIQPHESNPTASADGRSDAHVGPQGVQGAAAMDGGREHGMAGKASPKVEQVPSQANEAQLSQRMIDDVGRPDSKEQGSQAMDAGGRVFETEIPRCMQDKDADQPIPNTNPMRDLGSAQDKWRRDFNVVQDAQEQEHMPKGAAAEDPASGTHFEFAPAEDDSEMQQVLASATQEQAEQQTAEAGRPMEEVESGHADDELDENTGREGRTGVEAPSDAGFSARAQQGVIACPPKAGLDDCETAEDHMMEVNIDTRLHQPSDGGFMSVDVAKLDGADTGMIDGALQEDRGCDDNLGSRPEDVSFERGLELWRQCTAATAAMTGELVEQLRLVLEPTSASRLSGEFKTGKRLNMKKVIAYIASNFRRDKIWMRRTSPDKRDYQVMLAIDETKSMQENQCASYALQALTLLTTALSRLEVGTLGVAAFGGTEGTRVLHELGKPWTETSAAAAMGALRFDEENTLRETPLLDVLGTVGNLFETQRQIVTGKAGMSLPSQLLLIIADGHFHERSALRRAVRLAAGDTSNEGPLIVFIILDVTDDSVLELQQVAFDKGTPVFSRYLEEFPFPYYIILKEVQHLPRLLADLLQQWVQVCIR